MGHERFKDGFFHGLVDAENRKGSGIMTGILGKVLPEILILSWLLAALETRRHRLNFLSTASFRAFE